MVIKERVISGGENDHFFLEEKVESQNGELAISFYCLLYIQLLLNMHEFCLEKREH